MNKQIVIRVFGGLGNQLFQYFFAHHLRCKAEVDVFMDVSFYLNSKKSHERLRFDDLKLTWSDVGNSRLFFKYSYRNKYLKRLPIPRNFRLFREKSNLNWMSISNIDYDTYYEGYWQSYKYLNEVDAASLLHLSSFLDSKIPQEFKYFSWANTVSIHVRRGDYLSSKNHVFLGIDYYTQSINFFETSLKTPIFFVFSDDIEWAKINLIFKTDLVFFISSKGSNGDIADMAIMKNCSHHVIANSTYSWWGAWLSWRVSKGIVICPKKWPSRDTIIDICPEEWQRF